MSNDNWDYEPEGPWIIGLIILLILCMVYA